MISKLLGYIGWGGGNKPAPNKPTEPPPVPVSEEKVSEHTPVVPKKDISEPVLSFIEAVKNNPKRFKVKLLFKEGLNDIIQFYRLTDNSTKEVFEYYPSRGYGWDEYISKNISFLTRDERDFVYRELYYFFTKKDNERKERIQARQRKRLMKIYCGEYTPQKNVKEDNVEDDCPIKMLDDWWMYQEPHEFEELLVLFKQRGLKFET